MWHQFVRNQTETALTRDALHETFAIEMPGGAQVAITTSTAPIIYSKGGSILRQLEAWIGPDYFKAGLRRYLTAFAYGCAASHHLWESLSAGIRHAGGRADEALGHPAGLSRDHGPKEW